MAKHILDDFPFLKQPKAQTTRVILPRNKAVISDAFGHDPWQTPARAHDVFKREITEGVKPSRCAGDKPREV